MGKVNKALRVNPAPPAQARPPCLQARYSTYFVVCFVSPCQFLRSLKPLHEGKAFPQTHFSRSFHMASAYLPECFKYLLQDHGTVGQSSRNVSFQNDVKEKTDSDLSPSHTY